MCRLSKDEITILEVKTERILQKIILFIYLFALIFTLTLLGKSYDDTCIEKTMIGCDFKYNDLCYKVTECSGKIYSIINSSLLGSILMILIIFSGWFGLMKCCSIYREDHIQLKDDQNLA